MPALRAALLPMFLVSASAHWGRDARTWPEWSRQCFLGLTSSSRSRKGDEIPPVERSESICEEAERARKVEPPAQRWDTTGPARLEEPTLSLQLALEHRPDVDRVDLGRLTNFRAADAKPFAHRSTTSARFDLRRSASPKPTEGAMMRNDAGSVLVREDAGDFRAEKEHLGGVVHPHE